MSDEDVTVSLANLRELSACVRRRFAWGPDGTDRYQLNAYWVLATWLNLCEAESWPHAVLRRDGGPAWVIVKAPPGSRLTPEGVRALRKVVWAEDDGTGEAIADGVRAQMRVPAGRAEQVVGVVLDLFTDHLGEAPKPQQSPADDDIPF